MSRSSTALRSQRVDWIGRDFSRSHTTVATRRRRVAPLVAGALLAALALATLRIEVIRLRYDLADAVVEEKALLEQQRALTFEVRSLRNPVRLTELAQRMGLAQPARVLEIPHQAADARGAP